MIRTSIASAVFAALAATSAFAETPANSPEDCLKAAFDIAQAAEGRNLPNDQLDKVEEMLTKMESHCDANQYTEAAGIATDLKSLISKE